MFRVLLSENFHKQFEELETSLQERVKKILRQLETQLKGSPLKGNLKGFYSVHFEGNKYRLIYYRCDNHIEILVVAVGKRDDHFYERVAF